MWEKVDEWRLFTRLSATSGSVVHPAKIIRERLKSHGAERNDSINYNLVCCKTYFILVPHIKLTRLPIFERCNMNHLLSRGRQFQQRPVCSATGFCQRPLDTRLQSVLYRDDPNSLNLPCLA